MSPRLPSSRNAIAGLGLAAAGMVFRRFSSPKQEPEPAPVTPAEPGAEPANTAEVAQARAELADELARRAGPSNG